jgi:hypothetical protein
MLVHISRIYQHDYTLVHSNNCIDKMKTWPIGSKYDGTLFSPNPSPRSQALQGSFATPSLYFSTLFLSYKRRGWGRGGAPSVSLSGVVWCVWESSTPSPYIGLGQAVWGEYSPDTPHTASPLLMTAPPAKAGPRWQRGGAPASPSPCWMTGGSWFWCRGGFALVWSWAGPLPLFCYFALSRMVPFLLQSTCFRHSFLLLIKISSTSGNWLIAKVYVYESVQFPPFWTYAGSIKSSLSTANTLIQVE